MTFLRVFRLELVKLFGARKNVLYLLLPNLYPLLLTGCLLTVLATGSHRGLALVGAGLLGFLAAHYTNGLLLYPACILLRTSEIWAGEESDRTLRTLVLTQVGRGAVLAGKVAATVALFLAAHALFFTLFVVDTALVRQLAPAPIWEKIGIPLGQATAHLIVYTGVLAIGLTTLTLFLTQMALLATRTITVALLSATVLAGLWWALPSVLAQFDWGSELSRYLFSRPYADLFGMDCLKPLIKGSGEPVGHLVELAAILGVNGAILAALCLVTLRRKQFCD